MDDKKPTDVIYLDFKKAFDMVPHNELLCKLWMLGITGPLWQWFKGYITDRKHYVYIKSASSSYLPVLSGVPQGSVLGPLLFLIFVNDVPTAFCNSTTYLFADDTKIAKKLSTPNDSQDIQDDIDSLLQWCSTWNMALNRDKCVAVRFSTTSRPPPSHISWTNMSFSCQAVIEI